MFERSVALATELGLIEGPAEQIVDALPAHARWRALVRASAESRAPVAAIAERRPASWA